jgi:hypothetical protein
MKWFGPFGQKHSHLKLSLSEPNSMIYDILFVLLWISGYITVRNKALSIHIILTIMIASILIMRSAAHLIIDELSYGDISLHIGVIAAAASLFFYAHYRHPVIFHLLLLFILRLTCESVNRTLENNNMLKTDLNIKK